MELISLTQELERPPSEGELDQFGEYRYRHYEEEFGDLYTALDESGILPDSVTRKQFYQSDLSDEGPGDTTAVEGNNEDTAVSTDEPPTGNESVDADKQNQTSDTDESANVDAATCEPTGVQARPSPPSSEFADLTGFQRDILIVLDGTDKYKGLEIKEELEAYYNKEINHGRLYPNLDTLVEERLAEKISLDERSNGYSLSGRGEAHVAARQYWESKRMNSLSAPSEKIASIYRDDGTTPPQGQSDQSTHTSGDEEQNTTGETHSSDDSDGLLKEIMEGFDGLDDSVSDSE